MASTAVRNTPTPERPIPASVSQTAYRSPLPIGTFLQTTPPFCCVQPLGKLVEVEFGPGSWENPEFPVGAFPPAREITGSPRSIRPRPATNSTMLMMRSFFMTVFEKYRIRGGHLILAHLRYVTMVLGEASRIEIFVWLKCYPS